jgi:hypothetical protein
MARQLSELARELQADLTAEALLRHTVRAVIPAVRPGDSFGALNLYAADAGAFGPDSESSGILLASHAALAMAAVRTEAGLLTAMDSREVIGQAKGILMERPAARVG